MNAVTLYSMSAEKQQKIEETVYRERGRLLNFIRKSVPDPQDAEDVLQDVFVQLTVGFDEIRSVERISSWLFTVARNRITDLFRKKKATPYSRSGLGKPGADGEEGSGLSLAEILPDLSDLPDKMIAKAALWEALQSALDDLPPAQREVFVLHEFEDKSFKEIEKMTGDKLNTLLSRKRYAVLFLRERLSQWFEEIVNE